MKVVILAGGFGTRLSEYTNTIPKPMVPINGKPILVRIMNYFYNNGFDKSGVHSRSSYSLNKKNNYNKSQNIIFKENKKVNLLTDKDIELFFKANFSRRKKILNFMFELIR